MGGGKDGHVHLMRAGGKAFCGEEAPPFDDPRFTVLWGYATCPACDEAYEKALPRTSDGRSVRVRISDDP